MGDGPEVRVTSTAVKEQVLATCIRWLVMGGLRVVENRLGDVMTLTVTFPPESSDPHGDRMRAAQNAGTA